MNQQHGKKIERDDPLYYPLTLARLYTQLANAVGAAAESERALVTQLLNAKLEVARLRQEEIKRQLDAVFPGAEVPFATSPTEDGCVVLSAPDGTVESLYAVERALRKSLREAELGPDDEGEEVASLRALPRAEAESRLAASMTAAALREEGRASKA